MRRQCGDWWGVRRAWSLRWTCWTSITNTLHSDGYKLPILAMRSNITGKAYFTNVVFCERTTFIPIDSGWSIKNCAILRAIAAWVYVDIVVILWPLELHSVSDMSFDTIIYIFLLQRDDPIYYDGFRWTGTRQFVWNQPNPGITSSGTKQSIPSIIRCMINDGEVPFKKYNEYYERASHLENDTRVRSRAWRRSFSKLIFDTRFSKALKKNTRVQPFFSSAKIYS